MKIVVVDNDLLVRESLKSLLTACKFEVRVAENGPQTLDIARDDSQQDVFIIDKNLGHEMDGLEVADAVRELLPAARIILCSGDSDTCRFRHDQPYFFLAKPFALPKLLQLLNNPPDPK